VVSARVRSLLPVLSLLSLVACYPHAGAPDQDLPDKPGQPQALSVVLGSFGAPVDLSAPAVLWREGPALDCGNGAGWLAGPCVGGLFDRRAPDEVQVAWHTGDTFSRTSLAHELGHWFLFAQGFDPDEGHRGPAFAPGGLVDEANRALANAGF